MRARPSNISEITALKVDGVLPEYLYENLSSENTESKPYAYWLTTAADSRRYSFLVLHDSSINYHSAVSGWYYTHHVKGGVRPVITLSK